MITVNNYIKTNYYLHKIEIEEKSAIEKLRASNWERINRGERPEPLPFSAFRNRNEEISTRDVVVSCIAQGSLLLLSLAITGTFVAFTPQASLAAVPGAVKMGLIEGVLGLVFKKVLSLASSLVPEAHLSQEEEPSLLQDWHDHFTQLAALTPAGRFTYYKSSLKSLVLKSLFLGFGTYFWSSTFAASQFVSNFVSSLTKETLHQTLSFGSQRFYKNSPKQP